MFVWPALVLLVNSAVTIGGSGHVLFAISAGFLAFLYLGVCAGVAQYPLRRILWLVPAGLAGPALSGDLITRHAIVPLLSVAVAWTAAVRLPARLLRILDHHNRHLAQLANTDPLTGLRNRRALTRDLQLAAAPGRPSGRRQGRAGRPFDDRPTGREVRTSVGDDRGAIAILDLDDFKHFNDAHGHLAGDALLADFATFLDAATRQTDLVYRFGGEEFLILLPSTPQELATAVLEELTNAWQCRDGRVTFSAGIAPLTADSACLKAADANLYLAKRAGRNLVIAESSKPAPSRPPAQQGTVEHCGAEPGPVERAGTASEGDTYRDSDRHEPRGRPGESGRRPGVDVLEPDPGLLLCPGLAVLAAVGFPTATLSVRSSWSRHLPMATSFVGPRFDPRHHRRRQWPVLSDGPSSPSWPADQRTPWSLVRTEPRPPGRWAMGSEGHCGSCSSRARTAAWLWSTSLVAVSRVTVSRFASVRRWFSAVRAIGVASSSR